MSKARETWHSHRVQRDITLVRWGEVGKPLLIFPTAGGDAEECERFHLIDAVAALLERGLVKCYSVDSVAGQELLNGSGAAAACRMQKAFLDCVYHEVVPAIRHDSKDQSLEVIAAGASIGAFNALAALCRHPDVFAKAICMSGTYDLRRFMQGQATRDYHDCAPLDTVPNFPEGDHLRRLRERFVLFAHGEGRAEDPGQSWRAAQVLGHRNVPNRVDSWGADWPHDWVTWRKMLPQYVEELA